MRTRRAPARRALFAGHRVTGLDLLDMLGWPAGPTAFGPSPIIALGHPGWTWVRRWRRAVWTAAGIVSGLSGLARWTDGLRPEPDHRPGASWLDLGASVEAGGGSARPVQPAAVALRLVQTTGADTPVTIGCELGKVGALRPRPAGSRSARPVQPAAVALRLVQTTGADTPVTIGCELGKAVGGCRQRDRCVGGDPHHRSAALM